MTLAEVAISMAIFAVVLPATLGIVDTMAKIAPKDQEHAHAIREAQAGLQRMAHDLRQTYNLRGTSPTSMDILVRLKGQDRHVLYQCDAPHPDDPKNPHDQTYRRCLRYEAAIGVDLNTVTPSVVVHRILNGTQAEPVFTYRRYDPTTGTDVPDSLRPSHVGIRIKVPARGENKAGLNHSIAFDDGIYLRNLGLGG